MGMLELAITLENYIVFAIEKLYVMIFGLSQAVEKK